ncbi:MAG: MG2 domain-containing protein [Ignavibacteria bacterium]
MKITAMLFIFITLFILPLKNLISQEKGINFTISTANLYFPGDKIDLNVYSYDYSEKNNKKNKGVEFHFEILEITDINTFYSRQSSRYNLDVLSKDSTNLLSSTKEVYSFNKTLRHKNDYSYSYFNETVPISINSKGAYLIKVTAGNKVAYCGFIVSELGVISKAGNSSMLGYVVDRKSGRPVNNAKLSFFLGSKKIGDGITSDGISYQPVNEQSNSSTDEDMMPVIIGSYGDDVVVSDSYLFFGYSSNRYYTYLFTEQPVYRTNSTVNFKGTIRKNINSKFEPLENKDVTVIIKDPKGAEVYKEVRKTNNMGSFDGTFEIEDEDAIGDYTIYTNIDENNSYAAGFTVEQYKKPEYKVTVKTDKSQYYGRDNLKAEIDAKYFFGSPVTGAEVEYNIYKVRYYKPWWMFSEYSWWYEDYYENQNDNQQFNGAEFIYSGKGNLNDEGKLNISYDVNEDFKEDNNYDGWYRPYYYDSDYKYIVQAKVVDKSRREISGTTTAFVTRGGFYLNAKTDKYLYKLNENVNIEVIANDFSDKPVQTDFEATIYRSTWNRDYDYKEKKDLVKTLTGKTLKDGKGIVTYNIGDDNTEGAYTVEIKARDEKGNQISANTYFYVSNGDMSWYYNQSGGVQIIPDKDNYKVGEVCKALILVTNPDVDVLVTTNTDDILSYQVEKFAGSSKIIDIPITDKFNSNFEINVNYVFNGVFYNSSKSILVIPEEKFLTVQIDASKLIYKPKETGAAKVRVVDNNGNPVSNAEVSIGIVDESIYSIKEDNTKDIRKFFYGKRNASVSTAYNSNNNSNGNSRLITIYEKFNLSSTSDRDLATVKGTLLRKDNTPIGSAIIVINEDYQAAVTDEEGNFEFKLPAGEYSVSVYHNGKDREGSIDMDLQRGQTKVIKLVYNSNDESLEGLDNIASKTSGTVNEQSVMKNGRSNESAIVTDGISAPMMMRDKKMDRDEESFISADVRSDFRDAIFWSPYTMTDEDGYATVDVTYPDNLTSWRITSRVITEDTKVGQMTSTVVTRKDLLVRMETPRFLQENDEVTISTIIHNYLETTKQTKVKFSAENVLLQDGSNEKTLSIAPNTDVRVDWKVKVTQPMGEAKLYAEALTNEESDAVELKIPLQPKGLKINANVIADFSDEIKTEIKYVNIPEATDMRSAGMKFTVDPSMASTILSALDELVGYPYGCVEQTMSRFLPTVIVANAFIKLGAPISEATKKDLPKMVDKGLQRLYGFQHSDGGWGWWENDQSNPFMTAYVVYGLSIAKQSNYEVRDGILKRGISSIKTQLNNKEIDPTTRAYMLYSLAVAEEKDEELFKNNIDKLNSSEINDYARSLIAMTWKLIGNNNKAQDELSKLEKNVKTSGEGAAYWEGKEFHYQWQDDKVQTTAMALKAMVNINESSDLKEKVVRWLMMQRQGMAWRNTQETAMIIYALVDYLKNSNELDPNYSVKVFVNGQNVFEKQMTKENVFRKDEIVKIDNSKLKSGQNEIKIEKSGTGKVYFSSYTTYYLADENLSPREDGFRVEKEYFKLEKYKSYSEDKITYRKRSFDGNVKSGDEILVKIKVHSKDQENQYFMLEDPLPSGIEVVKDDWAYSIEDENNYVGYPYYYWRWWYADKEVRDNRVTFFATYINKGLYEFSYILRAQIPGDYSINPAKGMLMYYPEVYGSTEITKLRISD